MIAIIPARGGSKGVPRKNIKKLAGKPLIYYTIKAAQQSKYINRIIVSTDDNEIAKIAKSYGAEIPFMRPSNLAGDSAKAIDTYLYTMEELNKEEYTNNDEFIILQPTSPFRNEVDIDLAIDIYKRKQADSVISVVKAEHPPNWYKKITEKGIIVDYFQDNNNLNRQEYEDTYLPNGAIYILKYSILNKSLSYYTDSTYPYVMSLENSLDIDNTLDFKFAETYISMS